MLSLVGLFSMNVRFFSLLMSLRIKNCDLSDCFLPFIYAGSQREGPKGLTRTFHSVLPAGGTGLPLATPRNNSSPPNPTGRLASHRRSSTLSSHQRDRLMHLQPAWQPFAVSSFSLRLGWVQVLVPELLPVGLSLEPLSVQTQQ